MTLPVNFTFSQNNLQDYVDCPRRFELRYLQKLAWPAVRTEPVLAVERHMQMGERFHRMVQQHQSGLPAELVGESASEPELNTWWQAYLDFFPGPLPDRRLIEYTLAAPFGAYRLMAKYDLLAINPGQKILIIDWKTSTKKPKRSILSSRLQTRLYPFLVIEAGKRLNAGTPFSADQIELVYWFTADPANPEHFPYSANQFDEDRDYLQNLIADIENASQAGFPLTYDEKLCRYCNYRSLCDRGERAGEIQADSLDEELSSDIDLDFEQISEIAF